MTLRAPIFVSSPPVHVERVGPCLVPGCHCHSYAFTYWLAEWPMCACLHGRQVHSEVKALAGAR